MAALLDIRPDERRITIGAFVTLLGLMAGHTLIETSRDALFLAKLPVSRLPWVYLAVAAVGLALSRLSQASRGGARRSLSASMIAAAAVTAGFWIASGLKGAWFLYALYLWTGILASWVVAELWLVLGASYTVAQAKRLYGFIGAGSVLGAVLGAVTARGLTAIGKAEHLLLGGALLLAVTGLGPATLLAPAAAPAARKRSVPEARGFRADLGVVAGDPYVRRVLWLVLLATMTVTGVDFLFKSAIAASVPKDKLAAYLATVYVVLNTTSLVAQVVGVRLAIRALGVQRALWVMPIFMLAGAGYVAAGGALAAALLLRGADGTLRYSLHKTGTELLFVPLPDATRARAKPIIDLLAQRGGQALASLGIAALVALGAGDRALGVAVAVLAAAWLGVAVGLRQPYLDVFRKMLREGRVDDGGALPIFDLGALETLMAALNSPKDSEVLGALDLLAAQARQRLIPALILFHPSKPIVLRALELFTQLGHKDFVPVADRLLAHADPEVRTAALRARSAVEPDQAFLRRLLDDDGSEEVRATALVTLIARGWMDGGEAERALAAQQEGPVAVRLALARAIELEPAARFEPILLALAEAEEPALRAAVAAAMGSLGSAAFLPALVACLDHRRVGPAARDALVRMGPPALAALDEALGRGALRAEILWNIPRAMAGFDPALAAPVLMKHLGGPQADTMVKLRILRALRELRAGDPALALDAAVIGAIVDETLRAMFRDLALRLALEREAGAEPARRTPAFELLTTLLHDKEADALARLCLALGLLHPAESFTRIHRGLQSRSPRARASSRELLENVLDPRRRPPVLALVDDAPDAQRLERAGAWGAPMSLDYAGLLRALVERGGELGTLAAYHAAELGLGELGARISGESELGPDLAARTRELAVAWEEQHAT